MKQLGDKPEASAKRAQATLALQLCDTIVATTTLDAPLLALAANLYGLAHNSAHGDRVHLNNVASWVARRAKELGKDPEGQGWLQLHARLQQFKK